MASPTDAEGSHNFYDPLRGPAHSERFWTTVNAAEALPGVPTPLNWAWYDEGTERAQLRALALLGVNGRGVRPACQRDERHLGMFYGHCAINVDVWRAMADAIPGASGSALERDLLGGERPGRPTRARRGRYPVVALKAPRAMQWAHRQIVQGRPAQLRDWTCAVERVETADQFGARDAFIEAFGRYEATASAHLVATMAAQGLFDALRRVCVAIGSPGLEARLVTGLGTTEEAVMLMRLWAVSRGAMNMRAFLAAHGFQGPSAGELANASWRSDPSLLEPILRRYAQLPTEQAPEVLHARQLEDRRRAQAEFLAAVPRLARGPVGGLLRLVRAYLPLRESGRAGVLRTIDAGRAAALVFGRIAARQHQLGAPDDVFMLTIGELTAATRMPDRDEIAFRRRRWQHYKTLDIPAVWHGVPVPTIAAQPGATQPQPLLGIGTNPGIVEGVVRVVDDACAPGELEPGEVLVCHTTDPSWASLFLIAGAVVIDIGGPISHGAIVAREMGIPCVINTREGTRLLRTGDRVRVDGGTGRVEILADTNPV
jgi:pyruvate,water dikinase